MAGTFKVIVTPPAEQDLEGIIDYLTEQESYARALVVRDEILDVIESLEEMPGRHAPLKETYELLGNYYRRALANKYKVIFTVEETIQEVIVVNIMHIRRGPGFVLDTVL